MDGKCLLRLFHCCCPRLLREFSSFLLVEYMFRYPVHTWIFGHVHQSHDFMIPYSSSMSGAGNVRILCAPYGYPSEPLANSVAKSFIIPTSLTLAKFPGDMMY